MIKKLNSFRQTQLWSYIMLTIPALLYVFGIQAIMRVANCLPSGFGAVPVVVTILAPQTTPYYGLMYLALNVPFVIFFMRKVNFVFTMKTTYFLLVSAAVSCLFFIDDVAKWMESLIVHDIQPKSGQSYSDALKEKVIHDVWPMLVLPAIGGAFVGSSIALSWKYGGSTGGSDFVIYYFSTKRKMQVGSVQFIVSLITMFSMFVVLIFQDKNVREEWFISLIGSFTFILLSSIVVNVIFPKYSKVVVEVHSSKIEDIINYLNDTGYIHAWRVQKAESGYLKRDISFITTTMLLFEAKDFCKKIQAVDNAVWMSIVPVRKVIGKFDTKFVDRD